MDKSFREIAFDVLYDNPGCTQEDWTDHLINDYAEAVVDQFGSSPTDVFPMIEDYWDTMDFTDPKTGLCKTFEGWAETFSSDRAVELYDELRYAIKERNQFREERDKLLSKLSAIQNALNSSSEEKK